MSLLSIPIDVHKYIISKFLDKNSLYSYSRSCIFLFKIFKFLKFGKKYAIEHKQFNLINYFKSHDIMVINGNNEICNYHIKYILVMNDSKLLIANIKTKGIYLSPTSWIRELDHCASSFKYCKILF
jgi:hypothetical protein